MSTANGFPQRGRPRAEFFESVDGLIVQLCCFSFRREMKKVFPEDELVEIPWEHPIFNQKYKFSQGLPKIHEHDAKRPQALGIVKEGRLVVLFTLETDLGDGWEDPEVHNDPENRRQEALRMGANIISYVFSN